VFRVDKGRYNLPFKKHSGGQARMVVIDDLGNHGTINRLDNLTYFGRRKIDRRRRRNSTETMSVDEGEPRRFEPVYRRGG